MERDRRISIFEKYSTVKDESISFEIKNKTRMYTLTFYFIQHFMPAITICSDFGAQKIKSDTVSTVFPSISYEVMGPDVMIFVFGMLSFKPTFSLSSFTLIKRLFSSSSLCAIWVVSNGILLSH